MPVRRLVRLLGLAPILTAAGALAAEPAAADLEFFENKIRPVLVKECYECHAAGAKQVKGGLLLDTRDGLRKGGDSGPGLVPHKPADSLLIQSLKHESYEMPPKGKLPDAVIADFTAWIERGAVDPRDGLSSQPAAIDFAAARQFWAFRPPVRGPLPAVKDASWPKQDVDRYLLAALEAEGLRPVAPATPREWLRRVTFDLIGLPPTPAEIDAFLADESPTARERVVERLLASPHYGERWGRYWLDVARYAEDQAHTFGTKPNSSGFRYRDWVISAFNEDMPYDRFVTLQIAADLVEPTPPDSARQVAALGFFGLGAQYYKNSDAAKAAADELDDRVDTLTRGFLGLTVSCARCHDHKFDPIPTQDYYSLAGVFRSSKLTNAPLAPPAEVAAYDAGQARIKRADEALKKFLAEERRAVAEAQVVQTANYLLNVWKLRTAPPEKRPATKMVAEQAGLQEATLKKWLDLTEERQRGKYAFLAAWFELKSDAKSATDALPTEVASAAAEVQKSLEALLAERDGKGPTAKLSPEQTNALAAMFGEKGVFTVSDGELDKRMNDESRRKRTDMQAALDAAKKDAPPQYALAHAIAEATPADMKVFVRGNPARQGELAPRRFLKVIAGDEPPPFKVGSGRRELAAAIVDPANPLTARVMVNRIWQQHFGRGLVGTPSNFGALGERPTHPELLDFLAVRFVESGWSIKAIHREIVLSAAYALSSRADESLLKHDADNRLLGRFPRRRLDAEAWRDALLAVSGRLDRALGGPSTNLDDPTNGRRTVYGRISRHELDGMLRLFDFPDANITSDKRSETTVPQQQLFVLNSPFMIAQARAFAARLAAAEPRDDAARIRLAFVEAYGRPAADDEVVLLTRFVTKADPPEVAQENKLTRWERLAQALLAANEFMYVD